ncbi:MAG TPA: AbrB/MazE/SpoVT family DNA-binding domain-containing protein [Patescibacteria group bacterium]|jgi:AbrB family looped-hinge helix DNA binding protein|nr:AbrB/MazE/SpoVT family DNA-binding domain-containing protein [Patescibacteria group bacterium]
MQDRRKQFYGITTIGERGQVVIPKKARKSLKLKTGDKLLAMGFGKEMVVLTKISQLEKFASHLQSRLADINKLIRKIK